MKVISFVFLISLGLTLNAQSIKPEVLAAAGNTMKTADIQVEWTLGELAVSTLTNGSNQISQGFHQGLKVVQMARTAVSNPGQEISEMTEVQKAEEQILDKKIGIEFNIFPNPTSDFVNISQKGNQDLKMNLQVMNLKGQILNESKIEGEETKLDFTSYESGAYLIQVRSEDEKISKTYRVIKSK